MTIFHSYNYVKEDSCNKDGDNGSKFAAIKLRGGNSINRGGSNMAAAMLVKKICIEMAANDAGAHTTGTISISSSFLMQQTVGTQNPESLLQLAARIPNPNSVDFEMELDQTTSPNSLDVNMEVEESSDPNSKFFKC